MARTLGINVRIQEDAEEFFLRLLNAVDNSVAVDESCLEAPSSLLLVRMEQKIHYLHRNETKLKEQKFLDLSVDLPHAGEEV